MFSFEYVAGVSINPPGVKRVGGFKRVMEGVGGFKRFNPPVGQKRHFHTTQIKMGHRVNVHDYF